LPFGNRPEWECPRGAEQKGRGIRTDAPPLYNEVGKAAYLEDAVLRHGGVPHQVAAGLHIVNVLKQSAYL